MMNCGSCVRSDVTDINLHVDYISRLQYTLPPEKAIWALFISASHKHQLHPIFYRLVRGMAAAVRLFFFSFNFRCEYWCRSSEAIATGPSTICSSHR